MSVHVENDGVSIDEYLHPILLGLSLDTEDGGNKHVRTIGNKVPINTESYPAKLGISHNLRSGHISLFRLFFRCKRHSSHYKRDYFFAGRDNKHILKKNLEKAT